MENSKFHEVSVCSRVSVQGVKSLGDHFACLCRDFDFYEVKKYYYFSKTLLINFIVKSLQKEQNSTNLPIYQSAGINVQSPQSDSTPRRLTLVCSQHIELQYIICLMNSRQIVKL